MRELLDDSLGFGSEENIKIQNTAGCSKSQTGARNKLIILINKTNKKALLQIKKLI